MGLHALALWRHVPLTAQPVGSLIAFGCMYWRLYRTSRQKLQEDIPIPPDCMQLA